MHEFLTAYRGDLIARCRAKVAQRAPASLTADELDYGISVFLDQLIRTLQFEHAKQRGISVRISGAAGGGLQGLSDIGEAATQHGRELMKHGYTVDGVVHDYGDLCQSITDLAFEHERTFAVDEFRTLNRCLDNAIASAVTEFGYQREELKAGNQAHAVNQKLGFFAHELRNQLSIATLALSLIREGGVGLAGATGSVLDRALLQLSSLIDRSLAEVRMGAGMPPLHRLYSLGEFIGESKLIGTLGAQAAGCTLTVSDVDPHLAIDVDRDLLQAAVGNLLQNAFKFTKPGSDVHLDAYAAGDRILIEVRDHCGGLPESEAETLFDPFHQAGTDRSGLGLGLSIARRSVEANRGTLRVRDLPEHGCVFTIDLPRHGIAAQPTAAPTPAAPEEPATTP
jgi:signal transduction histidine kinase